MKRSASSSLSSTPDLDASSDFAPSPPSSTLVITPTKGAAPRKKVKTEGGSNNIADGKDIKPKTSISGKKGGAAGGPWTPAKKLEFAELVISRGIASMSADDLAKQLGLTKQQIRDATQKGKNNLRARLIAAAERV